MADWRDLSTEQRKRMGAPTSIYYGSQPRPPGTPHMLSPLSVGDTVRYNGPIPDYQQRGGRIIASRNGYYSLTLDDGQTLNEVPAHHLIKHKSWR